MYRKNLYHLEKFTVYIVLYCILFDDCYDEFCCILISMCCINPNYEFSFFFQKWFFNIVKMVLWKNYKLESIDW